MKLEDIDEQSKAEPTISALKTALEKNIWPDFIKPFKIFATELCFANNILLRHSKIVIPEKLRGNVLELAHEGHPGMTSMKRRLRSKVWWPGIDRDIERYVNKCLGCTLVSAPGPPEPMNRKELPSQPWQHLAIDYLGPLPSGHYIFVLVDYYSRFIEVKVMTKIDSTKTIKSMKEIFSRFGLPVSITADNGKQFISQEFKDYLSTNNIRLISTTPYWPQQNGEVERQNRSILKRLRISQNTKSDWQEDLQQYLLMYRTTPHSTTFKVPAELLLNRKLRDKLPFISEPVDPDMELRDRDREQKQKGKEYADSKRKARPSGIKVDDIVLAKRMTHNNKLDSHFESTPYKVVKITGPEIIIESTESGARYRRNIAHLKPYPKSNSNEQLPIAVLNPRDLGINPKRSHTTTETEDVQSPKRHCQQPKRPKQPPARSPRDTPRPKRCLQVPKRLRD